MSRNIILRDDTGGDGTSQSHLTVPSGNQDVRVVAQTDRRAGTKRKFSTKTNMAKGSKANARPARKIKLNRSIFNTNFQEQLSFRVKTLGEIKDEKQVDQETVGISLTQANVNTAGCSTMSMASLEATVANLNTAVDTRTVLKLNPAKKLMLPTIQLTRLNSGKYTRSITKRSSPAKPHKIMSEAWLRRDEAIKANEIETQEVNKPLQQGSPSKKYRISPIRLPESESEHQSGDTTWPPTVVPPPKVKLEKPPSPALSLGGQSDPELDGGEEPKSKPDARLVINTADENQRSPLFKSPPNQRNCQISSNVNFDLVDNDKLDVMSIMADDDELFVDDRQRPTLKRSLSQDSVFGNMDGQDGCSDLQSLLVKTKDGGSNMEKTVGDLIVRRPVSKSYKIPYVNQSEAKTPVENIGNNCFNGRNKFHQQQSDKKVFGRSVSSLDDVSVQGRSRERAGRGRDFSHGHYQKKSAIGPQGAKEGAKEGAIHYHEGGKVNEIRMNLERGSVIAAWALIKKLDTAKCVVDVNILEEMLKACESISHKTSNCAVGNAALGAFEMIQRLQVNCKPINFAMVIFTLCRCNMAKEVFEKYLAMKTAGKLPQNNALEHFINNLCKCLVLIPSLLIEFLQDVTTFPLHQRRKIAVVNNCVASLISSKKLQQVDPEKWNSLLTTLCSPSLIYVQSALQVHNIMEKHGVPLSATAAFLLFKLTQETGVTQTVLKLICSKATRNVLAEHKPPIDMAQILLSPDMQVKAVEEYFCSLFNRHIMPEEDILHHFVAKASLAKEYVAIYQLFLKSRKCALTLPPPVLKEMMEALEKWDENENASVDVYAALRLGKKAPKQPVLSEIEKKEAPVRTSERFAKSGVRSKTVLCHKFSRFGFCPFGNKCRYAHNKKKEHQFSSCVSVSEHSAQQSVGEGQTQNAESEKNRAHEPSMNGPVHRQQFPTKQWDNRARFGNCQKDDLSVSLHSQSNGPQFFGNQSGNCQQERVGAIPISDLGIKPDQKSTHGSGDASVLDNSGTSVVNKTMVNGLSQNPPLRLPFPAFQVLSPRLNNLQLFRKFHGDRPPFNPQFQRNIGNPMPEFHIPGQNHVPKWNHFQQHGAGKQLLHESAKQHPVISTVQHPSDQHSPPPVPEKPKVGRSFSWEPHSNVKPNLHNGWKADQVNLGSDNNNNGNGPAEFQHRFEMAVKCKKWKTVYACYIECKGANVKSKDLLMFRNGFVKNPSGFGQNFSAFVEFLYKENCSGGSCHSSQSVLDVFDQYDIDFIGALGVSLMEKCLVSKQFDEGYEILLRLHSHNISYFQSGKNFGAYTKDIPSQNVALIAVKLCLGIGEQAGLGAMEVLRACNYALAEEGECITPQDKEYRIKVLHQLYVYLFEEGHVLECFEVLQNLNAGANVADPMYIQVLNHFVVADDFEQSFAVVDKMHEKCMDLNSPPCHLLYGKFLKHCIASHEYDKATNTLKGMESRGIVIDGGVLRNILSTLSSGEQDPLANLLFEKCVDLKIYPQTFRQGALWLCELGCGYSQQEMKLLICKHLKQLQRHLMSKLTSNQLITTVQDLQIVLLPRLPGFDNGLNITDGLKVPLENSSRVLASVLQQDLNPPLSIMEQSGEQFQQKILVEKMSVYRWFSANTPASEELVDDQGGYDTLSEGSVASD